MKLACKCQKLSNYVCFYFCFINYITAFIVSGVYESIGDVFTADGTLAIPIPCAYKDNMTGIARQFFDSSEGFLYKILDSLVEQQPGALNVGEAVLLDADQFNVILMVTKCFADCSPELQNIHKCLRNVLSIAQKKSINRINMPKIGGEHHWRKVLMIAKEVFKDFNGKVTIYRPK